MVSFESAPSEVFTIARETAIREMPNPGISHTSHTSTILAEVDFFRLTHG